MQAGLRLAQRLAHGEQDRAVAGHQGRVMREHRIGQPVVGILQPFDPSAARRHKLGKGLVLFCSARVVEAGTVVPPRGVGAAHGRGRAPHQGQAQRRRHRLGAVAVGCPVRHLRCSPINLAAQGSMPATCPQGPGRGNRCFAGECGLATIAIVMVFQADRLAGGASRVDGGADCGSFCLRGPRKPGLLKLHRRTENGMGSAAI